MCGKTVIGRGICEIHVRFPMNNDVLETSLEYMWIDIWYMLDWIIQLRHKTAEMHFPGITRSTSEYTKWDAAVVTADRDEECKNSNPLQGLTSEDPTRWNEELCTESRTENRCWRNCERMKILNLILATARNWTRASAAGAQLLNHHASDYWRLEIITILYMHLCTENALKLELQS